MEGKIKKQVKTIAHRHGNSLKSLDRTIANGSVDAVECDVYFTDGRFAVRHGRKYLPFFLFVIEKRNGKLRPIISFRELWLEEVLERVARSKKVLVIDLKRTYDEPDTTILATKLLGLLREFGLTNRVIIDSKSLTLLHAVYRVAKYHLRSPVPELRLSIDNQQELEQLMDVYRTYYEKFLYGVTMNEKILSSMEPDMFADLKRSLQHISIFTINNSEDAERFIDMGASAICSDDLTLLEALKTKEA